MSLHGKILGEDYPKLISEQTIEQCFQNINSLGLCKIDVERMMTLAKVLACDVTKDIPIPNVALTNNYLHNHVCNFRKYRSHIVNGNLTIEKNVCTNSEKKRLTIYDKQKEMSNADNREFVEKNHLENKFDGICRFELNLNSHAQIRDSLNITSNDLTVVLRSESSPIADFLKEVIQITNAECNCSDWKEYNRKLVLQDCDFDMAKVEAKLRSLYKRGTKIRDVIKPYRALLENLHKENRIDFNALLDALR